MSVKYLVPDGKHLPYTGEDGKPDHRLMGAAWAALHGGYRGNKYEGADKDKAIARLRGIYKSEGMTTPGEEPAKAHDAILCRARVQLAPTVTGEAMFMPAGLQEIMPFSGGVGKPIKINVDANGASELEAQRSILASKGRQPYFDFDHADGPASFWVESFAWKPDGIYAKGQWTDKGKQSVEGKEYRYFSPVFYVDNKHGDPARIQCRKGAKANMGALINDPAFHNISPLWAKNAGDGDADNNQNNREQEGNNMTDEEIAGLRAKQTELETKLDELRAKQESGVDNDAEMRATMAELEATQLKAKIDEQSKAIVARQRTDAQAAVKAAVMRGAVESRNFKLIKSLEDRATQDPSFIDVIKGMKGQLEELTGRVIGTQRVQIVGEDPSAISAKMAKVAVTTLSLRNQKDKSKSAREFSALYAENFKSDGEGRIIPNRVTSMLFTDFLDDALKAGDVTDGALGTLAGTLVTQRTLELLKFMFPALTSFTTDFSDMPVTFNQTVMTRVVVIPNVTTYNTSTGWADSTADTTDVPVVMDQHKGVQITFNEQILASTMRKLFDEFAPAQAYALGKDMVDNLYTRITDANFTNNTVQAVGGFGRSTLIDVGTQLNLRGVPNIPGARTALLYSTFFGALQKDAAIISLAAFQRPQLIEGPTQDGPAYAINVSNFKVYEAPNLPTNNGNINGFAGSKSALCIVTRPPNDYTTVLPGAAYGTNQLVTDPDIGISVMLSQYINQQLANATSRVSLMYGTAAGQGAAGQLIKSNTSSGSSH